MTCPNCNTNFTTQADNCTTCGYPFSGTEKEKSSFIAQQIMKVGDIEDAKESMKTAKRILFLIGILNIINAFFLTSVGLGVGMFIGIVFIVFGFVVERSPILILTIALTLLLLLYAGAALLDPMSLLRGIFWKLLYIISLSYAIIRVKRAEQIKKESDYLNRQ